MLSECAVFGSGSAYPGKTAGNVEVEANRRDVLPPLWNKGEEEPLRMLGEWPLSALPSFGNFLGWIRVRWMRRVGGLAGSGGVKSTNVQCGHAGFQWLADWAATGEPLQTGTSSTVRGGGER